MCPKFQTGWFRGNSDRKGRDIRVGASERKDKEREKSGEGALMQLMECDPTEEEEDTEYLAEKIMGVGTENESIDIEEITERARMWVKQRETELETHNCHIEETMESNSHKKEPSTDVVDLSSSDDDVEIHQRKKCDDFDFNITNVRSLTPNTAFEANAQDSLHKEPSEVSLSPSTTSTCYTSEEHSSDLDDVSAHSELKHFKTGPLASIWSYEGHVGPLISPEMGGSLREVYSRITMDTLSNKKYKGPVEKLNVTYDLYLAENYKKSQKPPPDYRVIIQSMSSNLPNMKSLNMLDKSYPDKIPFLFAVVSGGTVTFFSIDRVELPRYFRDI